MTVAQSVQRLGKLPQASASTRSTEGRRQARRLPIFGALVAAALAAVASPAAATLTTTQITWDIIGLDSNNVNVGPANFPVGTRVCAVGTTHNDVQATLVWDSFNPFIDLRAGSANPLPVDAGTIDLGPGQCFDFFFEVELVRNAGAYDTTRRYHIEIADSNGPVTSTPTPRQLYVEHLISQNRNSVLDIRVGPVGGPLSSVSAGANLNLMVGASYDIQIVGETATGYNNVQSFINIPNVIFQVNNVDTEFTTSSGGAPLEIDTLWGDACTWVQDPLSPFYRSCTGTGKQGGAYTITYTVTILSVPGPPLLNPSVLSTLIYDFSGSSFHYNADYGNTTRGGAIIDPVLMGFAKAFQPSTTNVTTGLSTLTFTISNPYNFTISDLNFVDNLPILPAQMEIASPANATSAGCGSPSITATSGTGTISASNITVGALGACTISVNVMAPALGTYNNTSEELFIGTTTTGQTASASLLVNDAPPPPDPTCGLVMARWTMAPAQGTTTLPPLPSFVSTSVPSATASSSGSSAINTSFGAPAPGSGLNSWGITNGWFLNPPVTPTATGSSFFQFALDTSNGYTDVAIQHTFALVQNWGSNNNNHVYTFVSANGGSSFSNLDDFTVSKSTWYTATYTATGPLTGPTSTIFRINAAGQHQSQASEMVLDDVIFTGCRVPDLPQLSKAFSPNPVAVGATSTLVFTLTNPNDNVALTGVTFTDPLPLGLQVAPTPAASTSCGGTWTPAAGDTVLSLTGATVPAGNGVTPGTCTVQVNVVATTAGPHPNVSGFISSPMTGENTTATGYATANLLAVSPPSIAKEFNPSSILTSGSGGYSTLTFTINNPNVSDAISGVAFSDTFPAGLVVASSPTASTTGCGSATFSPVAGAGSVTFTGGTIAAGGTCTASVRVSSASAGTFNNVSGAVSHIVNGNTITGNTAADTLEVREPNPAISLIKEVGTSASGPWTQFLATTANTPIYYQLTVENIGDQPLSSVGVSDPTIAGEEACTWPSPLPVATTGNDNHIATCVVGPIAGGALAGQSVPNTATASGTFNGDTFEDTSSAVYTTIPLTLVKVATESSFAGEGSVINYTYAITNTSQGGIAGEVEIDDDKTGTFDCPLVSTIGDGDNIIDPGETLICTFAYVVTAADDLAAVVTNVATATAENGGSPVVTNSDTVTVPEAPAFIDLAVTKTNNATRIESGSSVTYTITVTNNGPDIDSATLSDPAATGLTKTAVGTCSASGGATCPTVGAGAGNLNITNLENGTVQIPTLPLGGSISFTVTATVTATNPAAAVVNSVTVTDSDGGPTELGETSANNTASDSDLLAQNFGHLPASYGASLNLLANGGARTLSGSTYLGAGKTTADDGIHTATYTPKSTDDGVTWTPARVWNVGDASLPNTGGSLDFLVTCPSSPCYLNGWLDWNADSDFNDTNEQVIPSNTPVGAGQSGCVLVSGNTYRCTRTFTIPSGALLDGRTLYSRFRISNQPMSSVSPAGLATNGGTALIGEIEDLPFQVVGGQVPTPITIAHFRARREGDSVVFRWSTASETGNVGFNLYVRKGKDLVRLNEELIPSRTVDSLDLQQYAFRAEGVEGDSFVIEDVSVLGDARRHGPFRTGRYYGGLLQDERIDWAAIGREHSEIRQATQQALREGVASVADFASHGGTTVKLVVRHTGVHRVTFEALKAAGVAVANNAKIKLTHGGLEVPIFLSGNKFGPGSWFEFYGLKADSIYTDANVYLLTVGAQGSGSKSLGEVDGTPGLGTSFAASYTETFVMDNPKAYANYSPALDAWYDTLMLVFKAPNTWSFPFQLDAVADSFAPATAELTVWGVSNLAESPDHHLVATINDTTVADEWFEALVEKKVTVALPAGTIREGANLLRLTLPADTGATHDLVNFDRLRVSYQRRFQARDGRLTFTAADRAFRVTNLASNSVVVYRVDSGGLKRLRNVLVQPDANGFAATFAGTGQTATYVVTTTAAIHAPAIQLTALRSELDRPADYLVVSSPSFLDQLEPLVAARQRQGLSVNVVDVEDLYTAYGSGAVDPLAIKAYLAHAAANLGTRYVLLVGGDTYDYKNYLGRGSISFIPSLYTSTGPLVRFVPSDALYTDFDDNGVPDLAIGRFPARTRAELDIVIAKTLAYEEKTYHRSAVFAADLREGALSFKDINAGLRGSLPPGWASESLSLDDMDVNTARTRLLAAMNRGTALITYTGHSGPREWTFQGLFNTSHAATLTNAGKPFVVLQWGCWNTYHVDPVNQYLVHSFLFSGDRGAAAVLGAATLVDAGAEELLGKLLTPRLATPGITIGEALQDAKTELAKTHPDLVDVLLGWSLMGDPALVVAP